MKLLFVSNFFPPHVVGGAEIVAARQADEMHRRGHDVTVFAGRQPQAGEDVGGLSMETDRGYPIYRTVIRSLEPDRAAHWQECNRLFEAVLNYENPDVVHFHNIAGLGAGIINVATAAGSRTIVTLHDFWGFCYRNTLLADYGVCRDFDACHRCLTHFTPEDGVAKPIRLRRDFVALRLSQADALISPSESLASSYGDAGLGRHIIVRTNGIRLATPRVSNSQKSTVKFLFAGYLGEHKGVKPFVAAVKALLQRSDRLDNISFTIVGDGHLRRWLESEIQSINDNRLSYLGKLPPDRMPEIFGTHDVLVAPSIWPENEPVVLLEAISAGLALIGSDIGGCADLISNGDNGLLTPAGDVDALTNAMTAYARDPALLRAHSAQNTARRIAFDEMNSFDAYEEDYQRLAQSPRRSASIEESVIICGEAWPTSQVTQTINALRFFEFKNRPWRFIPAQWADCEDWRRADALWIWGDNQDEALIRRALVNSVLVIGPAWHTRLAGLQCQNDAIITYADRTQMIAALRLAARRKYEAAHQGTKLQNLVAATRSTSDSFILNTENSSVWRR